MASGSEGMKSTQQQQRAGNLNMQDDAPLGANCAAPTPPTSPRGNTPQRATLTVVCVAAVAGRQAANIHKPTCNTCNLINVRNEPKRNWFYATSRRLSHTRTHIYLYIRIYNCLYSTAYAKPTPTPTQSQLLPRCRPDRSDINKRRNDKSNP